MSGTAIQGSRSRFNITTWWKIPFPSLLSNLSNFDLIICRNVMIYFEPDVMQRIVRQFHDSLAPGAWLLVGPSEPNMTYFTFVSRRERSGRDALPKDGSVCARSRSRKLQYRLESGRASGAGGSRFPDHCRCARKLSPRPWPMCANV